MDLFVLRHGLAGTRGSPEYPNDDLRPLTPKGVRKMVGQVRGLNSLNMSLDAILTSPLVRAVETAGIVHQGLDRPGQLVTSDTLKPTGDPERLIEKLAMNFTSSRNVMIVGHEPYLSGLVSMLVTGDPEPSIRLKKGALCKLRIFAARYGRCGWIEWALTPNQMLRLA